ncbi:MAG: TolC family protein [Pelagibacteraceae bacterium]|jgi:outer membrane protein|nr:TolC family protein [Pelagibacteraceae bacterium]HJO13268.1 TolC family protein [Alphaproteobacteria bacterium]MBO6466730.1 TolC family protein [Pelagibacteraceae bacterium]MBO6467733.1 TolC family protein [Pelagibacteraceae bacterium]MBO6469463.1 TolC family protein [Pelagibacteraceae bacterium]
MFKFIVLFVIIFFSFKSFSIDVDETIESTVQNNPKVKIGLEKLIESKEFIESAYGAKLPTITSTITGTYSNAESQTTTSTTTPETFTDKYKLSITQNLFDAGYNDLEIDRSKILFDNEVINFKIIIQDLILDAITGYLTVINYEKSLEATEKNFESVSKALEITKTKFDLGSSTLYDLQKAESFSAIASANLFAAEQNVEISKKSFQTIAGLEPVNLEDVIDIESSITLSSVLKTAMNNNLILKLLINDTKNKEILLLKEKKTKQPNIDIVGSAEYSDGGRIDDGTETTKGSVALTLTIPIYQQGIKNSNIRKYQSQILQAELNFEDYKEDLKILISNAYKDFKISEAKMNSNSAVIQASQTALESLKQEYDFGTKTITDLIEEEGNLLLSSVDYLDSKKNYLINYFKIKSLEGTLLNTFENYLPVIN